MHGTYITFYHLHQATKLGNATNINLQAHNDILLFLLNQSFIIILFNVSGFASDGEFNSLRTRGNKRPVHLIQLIRDARDSVSRLCDKTLLKFLIKTGGIVQ